MTPHQALALGVRLFVVWCALVIARDAFGFLMMRHPEDDFQTRIMIVGVACFIAAVVLLILWFFPKSIARGLLPQSAETPTQALSYEMWFTVGTALLGLWLLVSSITPILRNLTVMYVLPPELVNAEDVRSLKVGLFYHAVQIVLGLCLLFGATGIRKLIWRIRYAGSD